MAGLRYGVVFLIAGVIAIGAPASVRGQPGHVAIMVVDFQSVVRNSDAAHSVHEQIDRLRQSYQEEFGQIEEELRALETQLTEDRSRLSAEEFAQRRRSFEQRVTEAQREAQVRRATLDGAFNAAMDEVRGTLLEVIADLARNEEVDIVLSRSQVVLVDSALEFSDEALAELNARLPSVTVQAPIEE